MRRAALAGLAALCGCSAPQGTAPQGAAPGPVEQPRILHFYAYPSAIPRGSAAQICYGVENAAEVRIEPHPGSVPAYANRCIEVSPGRKTEYTLTASGRGGRAVSQRLTLEVTATARPESPPPGREPAAAPSIVSFTISPASVAPGGAVTLCYETSEASSVQIEPPVVDFPLPARGCFGHAPKASTTYRLTVSGPGGSQSREVSVTVR